MRDFDAMITYLANNTQVGQTVTLTILRDGKEMQIKIKLGERPQ
jgi:S1-C subfamily serine protease